MALMEKTLRRRNRLRQSHRIRQQLHLQRADMCRGEIAALRLSTCRAERVCQAGQGPEVELVPSVRGSSGKGRAADRVGRDEGLVASIRPVALVDLAVGVETAAAVSLAASAVVLEGMAGKA